MIAIYDNTKKSFATLFTGLSEIYQEGSR